MATHDPEFYEAPKFTPEYGEPPPKQRGCFFYGCVIASVLAVLMIIALAVVSYLGYRFVTQAIEEYTSTAPVELPKVEIPEEQRKAVHQRVADFRKALDEGLATEPLVLTSDDLNALIEENPDLKGTVYAQVEGDKLKAKVSIPLDRLDIGLLKGRYLNGEAELKASLSSGVLLVTLESFEVNGKRPPENFLASLRQQNLAKDMYKDPKNAEMIRKFQSIEIKDDKIIIKARVPETAKPGAGPSKESAEPPKAGETKAVPPKAETKPPQPEPAAKK